MADVFAVKIPFYNPSDPQLWFKMCESTFALATPKAVTDPCTKFNYIVAHLPADTASLVRDVILKPVSEDSYQELQDAIIARSGESRSQEIRRLLAGEQLGDRKPSQLLRDMQRRADSHNVSDSLLLELFLNQMPHNVQSIIASIQPITSEKAADIADRILEVSPPEVSAVSGSSIGRSDQDLLVEIRDLRKQVDILRRSRTPVRHQANSRHRSVSIRRDKDICWFHGKFRHAARRCKQPCSFAGKCREAAVVATCSLPSNSCRLFIRDRITHINFLCDTGSDVSILPATPN